MNKFVTLSLLALLGACSKYEGPKAPDGKENYALNCAGCHDPGPGHPATMLLEEMGRPVPALIGRKDLEYDYLHSVVRQGLIEMPPFRVTELTDTQVREIYDYIKTAQPPKDEPAGPSS